MVIGVSTLRISLPVFVAEQHGLFVKHGIDAEVRRYDTAQPLANELGAGRIDAGGYVAFPILFGPGAPPPKVRVFTAIVEDAAHPLSYLLVKKGSGLRGVEALRGRRIGILPTAAYRRWLEAILRHDGLKPEDVSIVPLAPSLEADALAGGGVDALFTGDPMATAALARGLAEPATDTPDVPRVLGDPFLFGTFAVTEDFARPAAMTPPARAAAPRFVDRYPAARYLRSREISAAQLDRALELAGTSGRVAALALP
jgi:NitT/TauT family transport system substrate-binding protein